MTDSKPTPAPWPTYAEVHGNDPAGMATLLPADYDHAARCVNAHDGLVKALANLADAVDRASRAQRMDLNADLADPLIAARRALAQVEV